MSKQWNKSQTLTSKKSESTLSRKDKFSSDSLFNVNVICDCSKELHSEYFSNKIPIVDLGNTTRQNIKEILNLDGKSFLLEELPFDPNSGTLEINSYNRERIQGIFNLYDVTCDDEDQISKCSCKNKLGLGFHRNKDLMRIFLKMNTDKSISILLIDPYHLVATNKYKEYFNQHKNEFKFCYSKLKELPLYQ